MTEIPATGSQLLLDPSTRVTCPKCEHEFSLADGFAKKSLEALEQSSHGALAALQEQARRVEERRARENAAQAEALLRDQLAGQRDMVETLRRQHAESLEQMRALEREGAARREAVLRASLEERDQALGAAAAERDALQVRARALAEQEARLAELVDAQATSKAATLAAAARAELVEQLQRQQALIDEFQKVELELRRDREALEARQQQLEVDVQRRMEEERARIAEAARSAEAERAKLREGDLQKKLEDTLAKLAATQRQLEQGSQQLQGEVLELILEEELAAAFPLDDVAEVRKGVRGADARHSVMTRTGQAAGTILWEAKRAQKWGVQWPAKLKEDMREAGAEVGVIVTTSFPLDWPEHQPFGLYEDVWVTGPVSAVALATALRTGLLEAYKARVVAANKGENMEAVYDYLTSPQFAHKLRAVYDAFRKMRDELNGERTTMQQRWKRREKQIHVATAQLIAIAGDLQGLAQQDLPQLELEPQALEHDDLEVDEEAGPGT
ncbi:MAG TPA: DUF2130 domain-containing protein [Steroidobacteraceae bacterium]